MNILYSNLLHTKISRTLAIFGSILTIAVMGSGTALAASSSTPPRCLSEGLSVSLGQANGTAGSTYYPLNFKNITSTTCSLYGYPGVSALRNGSQLGEAAVWEASVPENTVTLKPGVTANAVLQVTDVGNYPVSMCKPETATQLRVYAPGAYDPNIISKTLTGCSVASTVWLHAEVVR